MLFAHVSDRPTVDFSQRTRNVASLRGWTCAQKDGSTESLNFRKAFFSRRGSKGILSEAIRAISCKTYRLVEVYHAPFKSYEILSLKCIFQSDWFFAGGSQAYRTIAERVCHQKITKRSNILNELGVGFLKF